MPAVEVGWCETLSGQFGEAGEIGLAHLWVFAAIPMVAPQAHAQVAVADEAQEVGMIFGARYVSGRPLNVVLTTN